ncbi:MAG: NYN domain-containing protein [Rubrivivax sp.]|nr:NYN domain-containing protein [Rubrivivax sp.]
MTTDRVMLLIDADNVSVDVMEQTVKLLIEQHGALHLRRAYGTAEGAVKHQAAFKRLGIKPMVNLATGKNSTDIALAVDAIDLVLAERPDVVAIASSDSDFAPLVNRLREKGCVVRGFGQEGKTGDETQEVYDDYTVLAHRKVARTAATKTPRPARKTATKTAASRTTASATPASTTAASTTAPGKTPAAKAPATPAKKAAPRRKAAVQASAPPPEPAPPPLPEKARQILDCLPELERGETLELRVVSVRLREAGLLSRSGSSTKLLSPFAGLFELLPAGQPNHVRLRKAA